MLRNLTRIAIAATLLGSASVAMAAPRHINENGFRAVYQESQVDSQRTTGYTGPSAGSTYNGQIDRTGRIEE